MQIGQKIIKREMLTEKEADLVCRDLIKLSTGVWDLPDWAAKLGNHYEIAPAHAIIQLMGWQSAAMAYKYRSGVPMEVKSDAQKIILNMLAMMVAQEKRETEEFHWSSEAFKPLWDDAKRQAETWLAEQGQ